MATVRRSFHGELAGWGWFGAWALVGCAGALGAVVLGPVLFLPVALAVVALASRRQIRHSAYGLVTGIGVLLLYVAWVQRAGPGTTCWTRGTASGCDEHLDPLPWLIAGFVLSVGGVAAHAARR